MGSYGFGILELIRKFIITIQGPGNILKFLPLRKKFWKISMFLYKNIFIIPVTLGPCINHLVYVISLSRR